MCVLCNKSNGLIRKSSCDELTWAHPMCVLFIAELTVDDNMRPLCVTVQRDRFDLVCSVCGGSNGVAQCHVANCMHAAHPHCAFNKNYQMAVRLMGDGNNYHFCYEIYCHEHKFDVSPIGLESVTIPLSSPNISTASAASFSHHNQQ